MAKMDDQKVYDIISRGDTIGIFQLEGFDGKMVSPKVKPQNFMQLSDLLALLRPGAKNSGQVQDYIERKEKREPIRYIHPKMEKHLKSTMGLLLYQENLIECAKELANWSLSEADVLREVIGKKNPEKLAKMKPKFYDDCQKNGIEVKTIDEAWSVFEAAAAYSFNKGHSVGYAHLTYLTGWFKARWATAFYYGKFIVQDGDKFVDLFYDSKRFRVRVLPPSIESLAEVDIVDETTLRLGINNIKGVHLETIMPLIEKARSFNHFLPFLLDILPDQVPAGIIPCVEAGVFDCLFGPLGARLRRSAISLVEFLNKCSTKQKEVLKANYDMNLKFQENIKKILTIPKVRVKFNEKNLEKLDVGIRLKIPLISAALMEYEKMGIIFTPISDEPLSSLKSNIPLATKALVISQYKQNVTLIDHSGLVSAKLIDPTLKLEEGSLIDVELKGYIKRPLCFVKES